MRSLDKEQYHSELKNINWDFTRETSDSSFSAYHWYPARYVPQLPSILISYFSEPGDILLDPFCGSGTTLLEAYKAGRFGIGVDLNPIAVLMARAKLITYNTKDFREFKDDLITRASGLLLSLRLEVNQVDELNKIVPNFEENSNWYHQQTLVELAAIWTALSERSLSSFYCAGVAAFSAILRYCCSQEKHWGWICDNVKPKKLIYKNAITSFIGKLDEFEGAASELHQEASELQEKIIRASDISFIEADCLTALSEFEDEYFDLVVTSPPYYNMTDYVKSQRLSNLWLSVDTNSVKKKEIGARHKRGGLNSLDAYLLEMQKTFTEIVRTLKRGKACCVVLGESPRHAPYLDKFELLCAQMGFDICDSITRKVSLGRSLVPSLQTEKILIMKKK